MKTVIAAAALAGIIAAAPAWHLDRDYSGARIARRWTQVTSGNSFCTRPGQMSVSGRVLTLTADGTYGDCERLVSPFAVRYGLTAARAYLARAAVRNPAAWPAWPEMQGPGRSRCCQQLIRKRLSKPIQGVLA